MDVSPLSSIGGAPSLSNWEVNGSSPLRGAMKTKRKNKCEKCNGSGISYLDSKGNSDHMNAHLCDCGGR